MREVATIAKFGELVLAPALRQKQAAAFALVALAGAQVVNRAVLGYAPTFRTLVDGSVGNALTAVNTNGGKISFEFEFDDVEDVLMFIAAELPLRSPRRSGDYIRGHILLADGVQIPMHPPFPRAREFVFVNTVRYARKIEMGTTESGRAFVIQVPPHVYEMTAQAASKQFPKASIEMTYRGFVGGEQVNQAMAHSSRGWFFSEFHPGRAASGVRESRLAKKHGRTAHNRSFARYPAIIVAGTLR